MLRRLREFMDTVGRPATQGDPAARIRLAVAALLVEIARADHNEQASDQAAMIRLVARYFQLEPGAAAELVAEARSAVEDAVSLREFTAFLHQQLDYPDKQAIIAMLWDVALDDQDLDKYEDYLIGKIADLLYVSRGDVIRLRFEAGQRRQPS